MAQVRASLASVSAASASAFFSRLHSEGGPRQARALARRVREVTRGSASLARARAKRLRRRRRKGERSAALTSAKCQTDSRACRALSRSDAPLGQLAALHLGRLAVEDVAARRRQGAGGKNPKAERTNVSALRCDARTRSEAHAHMGRMPASRMRTVRVNMPCKWLRARCSVSARAQLFCAHAPPRAW
jgi:hypothetical protein